MRISNKVPFSLAILAGSFWFAGGVCAGITGPVFVRFLAPVLTLIGGTLGGILAERAYQADRQAEQSTEDDWGKFECANCGDVHSPVQFCYCGCAKWRRGARILQ